MESAWKKYIKRLYNQKYVSMRNLHTLSLKNDIMREYLDALKKRYADLLKNKQKKLVKRNLR